MNSSQPNNSGGNEDNLILWDVNGGWNDGGDTFTASYVVEWNADDVLDATQALNYSLQTQTVAGAFAINADTGVITVADGSLLDYETNATHTITVRVTDVDNNAFDRTFSISLEDLAESNNAPTNLSSGIELNTDGGNNAYLFSSNGGAIFGGLGAMTLEYQFASTAAPQTDEMFILQSYELSGHPNEVLIYINQNHRFG